MNNTITVSGSIFGNPEFSHEVYGEKFYNFYIESERTSGKVDTLMCVIPEILIKNLKIGEKNKLIGEIRTRNYWVDGKSHLQVFVFVKEIAEYYKTDINEVEIVGYIANQPIYRKTPLGREITDVLIAHNGKYGKSSYIPTIVWGRNAMKVSDMEVGTKISVKGRLQSREHLKRYEDGTEEIRTVYELSINNLKKEIEDED